MPTKKGRKKRSARLNAIKKLTKKRKPKMMTCWELTNMVIPHTRRLLMSGPPGTGKTHLATVGVDKCYPITLTEGMPEAELRGHYIPAGDGFVWQDGPAIRAWREGARLVLNEIDKASDEIMTFLHVILDDMQTAFVTLPTGERVRPSEGFHVVATMNGEPHDLPDALRDRFPVKVHIDTINPAAIAMLPEDLRNVAEKTSNVTDLKRRLSIRAWDSFANLRDRVGNDVAGLAVFGKQWTDLNNAIAIKKAPNPDFKETNDTIVRVG